MKKLLYTLLFCCCCVAGHAQHELGIQAGINTTTTVEGKWSSDHYHWGMGGYVGGIYQWNINDRWALQPQLLLSYDTNGVHPHDQTGAYISRYAISIPVEVAYKITLSDHLALAVSAGPYLQCAVYGKTGWPIFEMGEDGEPHQTGITTRSWRKSVEFGDRLDYGVQGGVSLRNKQLMYSLKCKYGFRKNTFITSGHQLGFQLGVSYFFPHL